MRDIRQQITDTIIRSIEKGDLLFWRKPWATDPNGFGLATSLSTGKPYGGINQVVLQAVSAERGYESRWFGTFQQIKHTGGSVRKGEKGIRVVLWKPVVRERKDERGDNVEDKFLVMREFTVFSVEQCPGLDRFRTGYSRPERSTFQPFEKAERLIAATGARVVYGGDRAWYRPADDLIKMPHRHQFDSAEDFYATLLHELVHRGDCQIAGVRPKSQYAFGELVAELGACFLLGELGIPSSGLESHASYIESWLKGMRGNTNFIFRASAAASKVVDHLLSHVREAA